MLTPSTTGVAVQSAFSAFGRLAASGSGASMFVLAGIAVMLVSFLGSCRVFAGRDTSRRFAEREGVPHA